MVTFQTWSQWRRVAGKFGVHALLVIFAVVLTYIVLSLIFRFVVASEVFFGLSLALLFFTLGQSFYEIGARKAVAFLVVTSVIGFLAEVLGTSTGFPFGKYYYTNYLGPKVFGVPQVVPLVWFVIAYLAYSIADVTVLWGVRTKKRKLDLVMQVSLLSAFGAVAWDFLVDPMFSSYGYWKWTGQFLPLPELDGIPLTNFVGWFVLVALMVSICLILLPAKNGSTSIVSNRNTLDSQIAYALLLVDGGIANYYLQNYAVIAIGAVAMISFLAISFFSQRSLKIDTPNQLNRTASM